MDKLTNIKLKQISEFDKDSILKLSVNENQKYFIESNFKSLEEANILSIWRPIAIYYKTELIGFAMYGKFSNEGVNGRVWLDRLMIDKKYQGKGYGKKSLDVLVKHIYKEYNCKEIYLSIYKDNIVAESLYKNYGFEFNGELDENGEKIMVLIKNIT